MMKSVCSNDNDEEQVMHSKSDKFMIYDNADEVVDELLESLLNVYQFGLERSMRSSDIIFDCVHLLYYKYYKINPNRSE